MPVSLEMQQKVAEWRLKAKAGTLTLDETREAIKFLRQERLAMPQGKPSTRKSAATPNADDLLSELGL